MVATSTPYRKGEDEVRAIRNRSQGEGHQKYVIEFVNGTSITVEAQRFGRANLTSSDRSLEAVLSCK